MPARKSKAVWNGSLTEGKGQIDLASGAYSGPYDWRSRAEDGTSTNPEELIAAAHAGCFNMALSAMLGKEGHTPNRLSTTATVHFEKQDAGFAITKIDLETEGDVPGLDEAGFTKFAEMAKTGCPVSKALASVPITLTTKFAATA
ncbi:MAG: OsmC family protein [Armatimonadetes bacterium]|nr:OsmC family protein [Armatimonadota bacterium]